MSKDHYISATFLTNFADKKEMSKKPRDRILFQIDKTNNNANEMKISSIACQNNLDGNRKFPKQLKSLEDKWNDLYTDLINDNIASSKKDEISQYLALLSFNNPKKQRDRINILLSEATKKEKEHIDNNYNNKKMHIDVRDIILEDIGESKVFCSIKDSLIRSQWSLMKNDTAVPFITSDNPILVCRKGWFVPISKEYLLYINLEIIMNNEKIAVVPIEEHVVKDMNISMQNNAERFFFSGIKMT